MTPSLESTFKQDYQKHLQHLKLKGLQPKTIDAYSRAIRRIGKYFDHHINDLSEQQPQTFAELSKSIWAWQAELTPPRWIGPGRETDPSEHQD